jgi:hypothetical protein
MFGTLSPSVKNLLAQANEWKSAQNFTRTQSGATTSTLIKFTTPFDATSTATQQVSPAMEWEARGWKTDSPAASQRVNFRQYLLPFQGSNSPIGSFRTDISIAGGAYSTLLEILTTSSGALNFPLLKFNGAIESSVSNSSTIGTLQNLLLTNPSGSKTNIGFKFGSTIKAGFGVDAGGTIDYKGLQHTFFSGSTADSALTVLQIYGNGIYNNYSNYNNGAVTAGLADTGASVRLSTYGGFAGKGVLVTGPSYTYGDEMVIYGDGSNANLCSGTPAACSTYLTEGNCNAHTGVGCSWFAGNSCSVYNGDQSNCTAQSGCTWEEQSCSGANNTDQSTCEAQDDSYGGNCSWDTSTCPSQPDQSSCQAITGCTWNSSDCADFNGTDQSTCEANNGCTWQFLNCDQFNGTDQSTCEANSGCSWDSDNIVCNGSYSTNICLGNYNVSCSGDLCSGNYATGNCTGTYGSGCQGTANCNNLTDDGETLCEAESGCTWASGANYILPSSTVANRGNNTSRFYYTKNIGASGNIGITAGAGDTLESSVSLAPGESVLLHHFTRNGNCSDFNSATPCNAQGPCVWNEAVVCSSFGDESNCINAGCSWDGSSCSGAGSSANCSGGTYVLSKKWYKLATI